MYIHLSACLAIFDIIIVDMFVIYFAKLEQSDTRRLDVYIYVTSILTQVE